MISTHQFRAWWGSLGSLLPRSPDLGYLSVSVLMVSTAAWAGAAWTAHPLLGVPAGVWCILLGWPAFRWWRTRLRQPSGQGWQHAPPGLTLCRCLLSPSWRFLRGMADAAGWSTARLEDRLSRWHDRLGGGCRPITVALDLPPATAELLHTLPSAIDIRWVPAESPGARFADAIVRFDGDQRLVVTTAVAPGRPAARGDWDDAESPTYASVFPVRFDPERVTLCDGPIALADRALLRRLVECAALCARTRARLTLADRLAGRRPLDATTDPHACDETLADAMRALADQIDRPTEPTLARRAAARAVSAWLVSDHRVDESRRVRALQAASRILGDHVTFFRLAAAQIAAYEDDDAVRSIVGATGRLRDCGLGREVDPLPFVQSELTMGRAEGLTLGRIAAGLGMLFASRDHGAFLLALEDLDDEMRFVDWLVGRDPDRLLVHQIRRHLELAAGITPAALPAPQLAGARSGSSGNVWQCLNELASPGGRRAGARSAARARRRRRAA